MCTLICNKLHTHKGTLGTVTLNEAKIGYFANGCTLVGTLIGTLGTVTLTEKEENMIERPRSKFEDENGSMNIMAYEESKEYPEVLAWWKEYAQECDRLSELQVAKLGKRHWGRWVLTKTRPWSLDCIQVRPGIGESSPREIQAYWIELSRIGSKGESNGQTNYTWQRHLGDKNWIGKQGLADFMRAIKEIAESNPEWLHKDKV